jgi:antirestriction protein
MEAETWSHENAQVEKMGELRRHVQSHQHSDMISVICHHYVECHPDDKVAKGIWNEYEKEGDLSKECLQKTRAIREVLETMKDKDILV